MKPMSHRPRTRGLSLIELLVAMTIALVVTLVITSLLISSESSRRVSTSVIDVQQTSGFLSQSLDRFAKSAGSGFAPLTQALGCQLSVQKGSQVLLPRPSAWPAPFASVPQALTLAPALIVPGATANDPDTLVLMTGTGGLSSTGRRLVQNASTSSSIQLRSVQGVQAGDLALLFQNGLGCMLQQVSGNVAGVVSFSGDYAQANIGSLQLARYGDVWNAPPSTNPDDTLTAYLLVLGRVNAPPQMQLVGVDPTTQVLSALDILDSQGLGTDTVVPVAEGVVQMRALYGVGPNGVLNTWVSPTAAGYTPATVGPQLPNILALHVGLVLRTAVPDRDKDQYKTSGAAATVKLFENLTDAAGNPLPGLTYTYTVPTSQQLYRHRSVEFTIPLRNVLQSANPVIP